MSVSIATVWILLASGPFCLDTWQHEPLTGLGHSITGAYEYAINLRALRVDIVDDHQPDTCRAQTKAKQLSEEDRRLIALTLHKMRPVLKCGGTMRFARVERVWMPDADGVCRPQPYRGYFDGRTIVLTDTADSMAGYPQRPDLKEEMKWTFGMVAQDRRERLLRSIAHEMAHWVTTQDPSSCKRYDDVGENPLIKEYVRAIAGGRPPNTYARTNIKEDFAETTSLYLYYPDYLEKVSPKRFAFMKQLWGSK